MFPCKYTFYCPHPSPWHQKKKKKRKKTCMHETQTCTHARTHTHTRTCLLRPTTRCILVIMMYMIGVQLSLLQMPHEGQISSPTTTVLELPPSAMVSPRHLCKSLWPQRSLSFLLIFLSFMLYVYVGCFDIFVRACALRSLSFLLIFFSPKYFMLCWLFLYLF